MMKTQVKIKQLIIFSDGSSFKNNIAFKQVLFKSKDFKKVLFKSKKNLLSKNNINFTELAYRKQLFI